MMGTTCWEEGARGREGSQVDRGGRGGTVLWPRHCLISLWPPLLCQLPFFLIFLPPYVLGVTTRMGVGGTIPARD